MTQTVAKAFVAIGAEISVKIPLMLLGKFVDSARIICPFHIKILTLSL